MASVRQSRTRPEEAVAIALRELGVSYRRNDRRLPGSPDFANRRRGVALFVHGCFWHRHDGCPKMTTPVANRAFWEGKFDANVARDRRNVAELEALGFEVAIVWECETRDPADLPGILVSRLPALRAEES